MNTRLLYLYPTNHKGLVFTMEKSTEIISATEKLDRGRKSLQEALRKIDLVKKYKPLVKQPPTFGPWVDSRTLLTPDVQDSRTHWTLPSNVEAFVQSGTE